MDGLSMSLCLQVFHQLPWIFPGGSGLLVPLARGLQRQRHELHLAVAAERAQPLPGPKAEDPHVEKSWLEKGPGNILKLEKWLEMENGFKMVDDSWLMDVFIVGEW